MPIATDPGLATVDALHRERLNHLQALEAESLYILREAVAEFARPVMLYSIGKDSSVMLRLAQKAFYPGKIPFPLLHVDTSYKFAEMIAFRDAYAREIGAELIVHRNEQALAAGASPWTLGTQNCCGALKTRSLLDALAEGGFDAAFGGARRDEEKSRAKERVYSLRDAAGQWDPKNQRPELWSLYNSRLRKGESIRVFPLSNWTELDIWLYLYAEQIPIVPLYFAEERLVVNRGGDGNVDLSLLTDGLRAEREQGITIDVAYRYFSTSKRKFIIADTPGHEQYTRNMATGASTAHVAIVLIDANAFVKAGGLLPQSRRHTYIASLLRIPHVVAAVNKMDLVAYSEEVFANVSAQFLDLARKLNLSSVELVPVSALAGDNVVEPSAAMPWYTGPTLLEYLETVPLETTSSHADPLRFPVQLVLRPDAAFRGFAGRVERGELRVGQQVRALPSGRTTRVSSIVTYDGDLQTARAPQSVTVTLEDEIDLSRGEMLIADGEPAPALATALLANVVWMHEQRLLPGRNYLLKHTTRTVRATVRAIRHRIDVVTAEHHPADALQMNDIAEVELETNLPLFFDPYSESRALGSLILIDPITNATVAAAMIVSAAEPSSTEHDPHPSAFPSAFVLLGDANHLQRTLDLLHTRGRAAISVDDPAIPEESLPAVARALQLARVTAVSARTLRPATLEALQQVAGERWLSAEQEIEAWLK